jgi:MFS family permease
MFHQLFSNRESVVAKELGTEFYQTVRDFKNGVVAEFQMQGIDLYDRKAKRLLLMTSFVSAVMVVVMIGYAMNFFNVGIGGMLLTAVISIFIAVCSMLLSFVCSSLSDARKQGRYIGFVIAISSYIVILGLLAFSLGNLMLNLPFYILGMMCAFLCTLFGTGINILSNEGEELEVEALSYLDWLKEQLKMYGYSDSKQEFEYQKLSYFYFFGLSKTMLKLLQDIRFSSPDWYYCMHTSTFTPLYFLSTMESGMNSFASSSSPSSDSGSGGAGGGAGGGGGGSW